MLVLGLLLALELLLVQDWMLVLDWMLALDWMWVQKLGLQWEFHSVFGNGSRSGYSMVTLSELLMVSSLV